MNLPIAVFPDESSGDRLREILASAGMVGQSPAFLKALEKFELIATADAAVLVTGETGTGKELVARGLHYRSDRSAGPFVPVNCALIRGALLEDELFGHEPGAFTDARSGRKGRMALADHGTLFLDEVGNLKRPGQAALLRAIQHRSIWPLGSEKEQTLDVRFVTATNASLDAMLAKGAFRSDLFYRLAVFTISLPPLRERPGDILLLAWHFIDKHRSLDRPAPELTSEAEMVLRTYSWPGNVRELENVIQRCVQFARGEEILVKDLGLPNGGSNERGPKNHCVPYRKWMLLSEREYLVALLKKNNGNLHGAAIDAGLDRHHLKRRLLKHQLYPTDFYR